MMFHSISPRKATQFIIAIVLSVRWAQGSSRNPPNIIFILADDLGWNDVSMHGSPEIPTPNIDALASSSLILRDYYVQPLCTPSRSALMTGKYPIRHGLQHGVIIAGKASALPLEETIMPQYFKNLGYQTHIVGKWHLGYYTKECTPTFRGFDSFFGCYNGFMDYFDYTHFQAEDSWGIDLHDGLKLIKDIRGNYSTDVFAQRAIDIILHHQTSKPLLLYLPVTAPHAGSFSLATLQAPYDRVLKHKYIENPKRRTYAGMVSALDSAIGRIFEALHSKSMLHNTILVFSSDNGARVDGITGGSGSNWPLRGQKFTLWEGGVRVPALVWSPLLELKQARISKGLMHMTDWLPTLYTAAGGDVEDLGMIDGYSMWETWKRNGTLQSPRSIILHNIDPIEGTSAMRSGDFKLVNGSSDIKVQWISPSGRDDIENPISLDEYVFKDGCIVKDILQESGWWLNKEPDSWRVGLTVSCKQPPPKDNGGCDPEKSPCLFNIAKDPCEYNNLAMAYPKIVRSMMRTIERFAGQAVEPQQPEHDPRSEPYLYGFGYVPWLDKEYSSGFANSLATETA